MIKQYQKKFIALNLAFTGVVLLIVLTVVSVYTCNSYYTDLENTMKQVVKPFSSPMENPVPERKPDKGNITDAPLPDREEKPPMKYKNIITVFYSKDSGDISVLTESTDVSVDQIKEIAWAVSKEPQNFGKLSEFGMFYYKEGPENNLKIALTDTSYIYKPVLYLILILSLVFVLAMGAFAVISYFISKIAVRPLKKAMDMEKQFVTDISHDLKTPITVILANNKILKDNAHEKIEKQMQWLNSTEEASKDMLNMINGMLTLSAVDSTGEDIQKEKINLSSLLTKASLQMESVAYDKGIFLETQIQPDIFIEANKDYIQRICSGLLDNALKYEPENGKISVTLSHRKKRTTLSVRNYNSFIPPEDLPKVFERFYRVDKSRNQKDGFGLGLSIIKQMTEFSKGTINVESTPEKGTEFIVSF